MEQDNTKSIDLVLSGLRLLAREVLENGFTETADELSARVREGMRGVEQSPIVAAQMAECSRENITRFAAEQEDSAESPFTGDKLFKYPDRLCQILSGDCNVAPVTLEIHLTNKCQHACPECTFSAYRKGEGHAHDTLPLALVKQVLSDAVALGVRGILLSGGGEPTLHPDFREIVAHARSLGFALGLITNGGALHLPGLSKFIADKFLWVRVSVDAGTAEGHKRMHGASDFVRVISGVKSLADEVLSTGSTLGVGYLMTPESRDLVEAARLFHLSGVSYLQVKPIMSANSVESRDWGRYWDTRIFRDLHAAERESSSVYRVYVQRSKFHELLPQNERVDSFPVCYGHSLFPAVSADGSVYACCLMIGTGMGLYGHVLDGGLLRVWGSGEKRESARKIDVRKCPPHCRLAKTNRMLDKIIRTVVRHPEFLG